MTTATQIETGDIEAKRLEVSEQQRLIMRHALGLKDTGPIKGDCFRNYYYLYEGSNGFEACQDLVEKGLMVLHDKRRADIPMKRLGTGQTYWIESHGYVFCVTDAGLQYL